MTSIKVVRRTKNSGIDGYLSASDALSLADTEKCSLRSSGDNERDVCRRPPSHAAAKRISRGSSQNGMVHVL